MSLSTRTARLAADVSAQLPTSFTLESWRGNAFDLELGVFDGATVQDLSDVSSITCIVRNQTQSGIAMTKTVVSADIDNTLDSSSWQDESKQHATFSFTNSETNVAMGSDFIEYWMVFTAIMNDGAERTLAAGCFNLYNDRNNTAGNPPSNPGTSITLEQADARYLQAGSSVGDMLAATYDPASVEGDAFDMDNMAEGADAKILTAAERAAISASTSHTSDTSNPHSVTATQVGLGSVDNTSDADKPISTATQTALDDKQDILAEGAFVDGDKSKLDGLSSTPGVLSSYSDGDAAVVIVGGQSNAVGVMGTALASASNVHVIGEGERAFISYTATNSNAYQSANSFVNPTTALAEIWQSRIDGGASLPDLYIVTVASSGQGLSTQVNTVNGNRWNPNSLKTDGVSKWNYPVNGVTDSNASMYEAARVCVQSGLEDIVTQGKRPVLLGALWVQGEEDAKNANSGADYLANFQTVVSMFRSAAANDALGVYPYKLFTVPAMFANKTYINAAFDAVAADDSRVSVIDASMAVSYDAGDASDLGIFNGDGVHLVDVAHKELIEQFLDLTIDAGAVGVVSRVNHTESATLELDFSGLTHTHYASDFAVVATNSPLPFATRNAGGANGSGFLNERTGDVNAWRYIHQNGTISGNFFNRYSDSDLSNSVKIRCEADDRTKYNIAFGLRIQNYIGGVGYYNLGKEIILVQATGLTASDSDTGNATARVWRLGAGLNTVSGNTTTAISNLPAVDTEWFLRCSINGNEVITLEYSTDDVAWTEWLSYDLINDGGITADVTDGYRSGGAAGLYYGLGSVNGNFDEFKIHEVELR